jgi:hypothetical protein
MSDAASADHSLGTPLRTSDILLAAVQGESERVSIGDILDALDARAFGMVTLVFSLPSIIPMPPGVPTVVGLALLIVAIQMIFGHKELWLPNFLSRRNFDRKALTQSLTSVQKTLRSFEKITRPRMLYMTGGVATILIGAVVFIMAVVLILPLPPGGNFPPALACAVIGMGLAERDGVVVILGILTAAAAIIAAWLVTLGAVTFFPFLIDWIGRLFGQ